MCFFFNDTATTEIYTLSLHDALPIYRARRASRGDHRHRAAGEGRGGPGRGLRLPQAHVRRRRAPAALQEPYRSEEHTSELQSRQYLVCRLLLEKKKNKILYFFQYYTC